MIFHRRCERMGKSCWCDLFENSKVGYGQIVLATWAPLGSLEVKAIRASAASVG